MEEIVIFGTQSQKRGWEEVKFGSRSKKRGWGGYSKGAKRLWVSQLRAGERAPPQLLPNAQTWPSKAAKRCFLPPPFLSDPGIPGVRSKGPDLSN